MSKILPGDLLMPVTFGEDEIRAMLAEELDDEGHHVMVLDPREYDALGNGGYRRKPQLQHD